MEDYIRRGDVLDIAMQYCPDDDGSCSKADADPREMLDEIEALPSADVQPVKPAHWSINPDGYYPQCSNCGYEPPRELIRRNGDALIFPRYCSECGADTKREVK